MKQNRKRYSAEYKAKVALEAIKGEETLAQLSVRYSIHPNQIAKWKKEALAGLAEVFANKDTPRRKNSDAEIKDLHAKIGQLTVERDFLARAFGR